MSSAPRHHSCHHVPTHSLVLIITDTVTGTTITTSTGSPIAFVANRAHTITYSNSLGYVPTLTYVGVYGVCMCVRICSASCSWCFSVHLHLYVCYTCICVQHAFSKASPHTHSLSYSLKTHPPTLILTHPHPHMHLQVYRTGEGTG